MRELRTSARLRNFCAQFDDVVLGSGDYFGEQALITGDVRAATVTAAEDVSLLALDRENFQRVGDSSFQAPPRRYGSLVFSPVFCFSPGWCSIRLNAALFMVSRQDAKGANVGI